MKINEQDFKHLKDSGKYVTALKQLDRVKSGEDPVPHLNQLMNLMAQQMASETVPALFPYMLTLTEESAQLLYLNFVVNMKLGFYQRGDISKLTDKELRTYLLGIHRLRGMFPARATESTDFFEKEFKSIYLWNMMMIHSNSQDLLVLSQNGLFESPFKVKCPCCGNDLHSLIVDATQDPPSKTIEPASPPVPWEKVFFDDIYRWFSAILADFKEEHFSKILPYLYGTYQCSVCKEKSSVMEAAKAYVYQEEELYHVDQAFITRMEGILHSLKQEDYAEIWVILSYIVSLYRELYGEKDLKGVFFLLKEVAATIAAYPAGTLLSLGKWAIERGLASDSGEEEMAQLYHWATLVMSHDRNMRENEEEVLQVKEYFRQAVERMNATAGENSKPAMMTLLEEAEFYGRTAKKDSAEMLLAVYHKLQNENLISQMDLAHLEIKIAALYGKDEAFVDALEYKESAYGIFEARGWTTPQEQGDFAYEVGQLAELSEDFEKALRCYVVGTKAYLTQLGEDYQLPTLASVVVETKGKRVLKPNKSEELPLVLARSASVCFRAKGRLAFRQENYTVALEEYQSAFELWDWVEKARYLETARLHMDLAECYVALGEKDHGKDHLKKAIQIYTIRIKQSELIGEIDFAKKLLEEAQKQLADL